MPSWETCQLIKEYEDLRKMCNFGTLSSNNKTDYELKQLIKHVSAQRDRMNKERQKELFAITR